MEGRYDIARFCSRNFRRTIRAARRAPSARESRPPPPPSPPLELPVETTRLTAEPLATWVPAAGLSLITSPEVTVVLDCCVTVPRTSPAPVIAVVASLRLTNHVWHCHLHGACGDDQVNCRAAGHIGAGRWAFADYLAGRYRTAWLLRHGAHDVTRARPAARPAPPKKVGPRRS